MDEFLEDIAAQKELISNTLRALGEVLSREQRTTIELAAIATFIHNLYRY